VAARHDPFLPARNEPNTPQVSCQHGCSRKYVPCECPHRVRVSVLTGVQQSVVAFGKLWGLVACHSYGEAGMRVSFPMRHMLHLLSDSISRNIERLAYVQRFNSRKLVSTIHTNQNPVGYIVSNTEDLLSLFDADFGILVVGDGAKIMGANVRNQEVLLVAEYLRVKQFPQIQASKSLREDFPDLLLPTGPEAVAGMLYVPLSRNGRDFVAFLRRGQLHRVYWAGQPFKNPDPPTGATVEPRTSFKIWSETIQGKSRAWTDEQLETAGVLALVYGKVHQNLLPNPVFHDF
jgi:light-regulated signal transduction histidine kinase (bacteriophytochrome)